MSEMKDYLSYTIYEDVLACERLKEIIDRVSTYAEAAHQAGLRILGNLVPHCLAGLWVFVIGRSAPPRRARSADEKHREAK